MLGCAPEGVRLCARIFRFPPSIPSSVSPRFTPTLTLCSLALCGEAPAATSAQCTSQLHTAMKVFFFVTAACACWHGNTSACTSSKRHMTQYARLESRMALWLVSTSSYGTEIKPPHRRWRRSSSCPLTRLSSCQSQHFTWLSSEAFIPLCCCVSYQLP